MTPAITVLVPTFNRHYVLDTCLRSLMDQELPASEYEILVVDDGSSDATKTVVDEATAHALRTGHTLRYVHKPNGGLNSARNVGVREARGALICFADDDGEMPPTWLRELSEGAARHPEAEVFGGPIITRIEGKAPNVCDYEPLATELDYGPEEKVVDRVWGANFTARKSAFDRIGPFNENIPAGAGDEEQWLIRLLRADGTIVYLPKAHVFHRRVDQDLGLKFLLKAKWKRGVREVAFNEWAGTPLPLGEQLYYGSRWMAHIVRRRCIGGLLEATQRFGRAWGLIRRDNVTYTDLGSSP